MMPISKLCVLAALLAAILFASGDRQEVRAQDNFLSPHMPYAAFDRLSHELLRVSEGIVRVGFAPGNLNLPREKLFGWVSRSAQAVAVYYGRFPVASARLLMVPVGGRGVKNGQAFGYEGAAIRLTVGNFSNEQDLSDDWKMVHEMIHLATPRLADRHDWLTEGIAVYVESIARVQAGHLAPETIWGDFVRDMPKGLPGTGDRGFDNTSSWGRTYWGGASFCLLADVTIRERTHNARGLQDALRGVLEAGGNNEVSWPIERFIEVADATTGVGVLRELYEAMRDKPAPTDLPALWRRLGVEGKDGAITFDNSAELAHVRSRLTQPAAPEKRG